MLYSGQILRVDLLTQETSATYLTVTDDDSLMTSQEAGTIYDICGVDLPSPPVLDSRVISGTLLDGSAFSYTVGHFTARNKDFYILPSQFAPEAVASVTSSVPSSVKAGAFQPVEYLSHGMTLDDEDLLVGKGLSVVYNARGKAVQVGAVDVALMDDDALIQTRQETGATPQILINFHLDQPQTFDTAGGLSSTLVRLFYSGTTGNGSFVALRLAVQTDAGEQVLYLPRRGGVDITDIFDVRTEKPLTDPVGGLKYSDFGFGHKQLYQLSGDTGQFLQGQFVDDFLQGNGGDDSLVGGMGADRVDGGTGSDALHGGAQNDTLIGQDGNDALYGGNDRDKMYGDAGNDLLVGNWGNDSLYGGDGDDKVAAGSDQDLVSGGAGNDTVIGYDGNDRLFDGTGADQMNGGTGTDEFIMSKDASTDRILDFEDGVDHIDLNAAFASLTITTVAPGQVQIMNGTDTLLLFDTGHHLTAADLTAQDFI